MSSTLIVHCDVCKQQVTEHRTLLKVAAGPLRKRAYEYDVCMSCLPGVEAALSGEPAAPRAEAAAATPKPRPKGNGRPRAGA